MEKLFKSTTAYKILEGDKKANRLSHAYLLFFSDGANLRFALKMFACLLYGGDDSTKKRIMDETYPDIKIFPEKGKKMSADDAFKIVEDCTMRPMTGDTKIYVLDGFESCSAVVQNKLLKSLEEPPECVKFLLGCTTLSPVLPTVLSRVKKLEIVPFSEEEIYLCLERMGHNEKNRYAASSCGGILGEAQELLKGDVYEEVQRAAKKILSSSEGDIGTLSQEMGDFSNKKQLLKALQSLCFSYAKEGKDNMSAVWINCAEKINGAFADLKFNANFSSLIYDFILTKQQLIKRFKDIHKKV